MGKNRARAVARALPRSTTADADSKSVGAKAAARSQNLRVPGYVVALPIAAILALGATMAILHFFPGLKESLSF